MMKTGENSKETELSESILESSSKDYLLPKRSSLSPDYILVFKNPRYQSHECPLINSLKAISFDPVLSFSSMFCLKEDEHSIIKESLKLVLDSKYEISQNPSLFQEILMKTVMKLLQEHLGLQVKASLSADKDEIFLLLTAPDENLIIQGDLTDYKLQLSSEFLNISPEDSKDFEKVLPFAPLEKDLLEKYPSAYAKYDINGNPDITGKLFRYPDRISLLKSMLSDTFSMTDLYRSGMLHKEFPVHTARALLDLQQTWSVFSYLLKPQPLDKVRDYFGSEVAFYFTFLEFYQNFLRILSVLGVIFFILIVSNGDLMTKSDYISCCLMIFTVLQGLWSTFFNQLWIRKENFSAWKWGVTVLALPTEQRPKFRGEKKLDEVSGKFKKIYSPRGLEKYARIMGYGFILFCVFLVAAALAAVFLFKNKYHWGVYFAGVLTGVQIKAFNYGYAWLARKLTDWENLETNRQYFDSLTFKLFCFEFVNSYGSLLYIAFVKDSVEGCFNQNCIEELRYQLVGIFLFNFLANLAEVGIPFVKHKTLLANERRRATTANSTMKGIEKEAVLTEYTSPLFEYMEVIIDYGYFILFSAAFPLLPVFALILVMVETRVDAWKLCFVTRRPFPIQSNSIGIWVQIIQTVSVVGSITNLGIAIFTYNAFGIKSAQNRWVLFLLIEHILILSKSFIAFLIPDVPRQVKQGLIWSERIVKERVLHVKDDEDLQKSILAWKTIDPEKILKSEKIFKEI